MVATTATQLLRYPQTTDAPCDGDLHIQQLAEDIDAKLTSHDTDLALARKPPSLIIRASGSQVYNQLDFLPKKLRSDMVEHQVGGQFVDLAANSELIHFPRTGYYQVGLEINLPPDADTDISWKLQFLAGLTNTGIRMEVRNRNFLFVTGSASGDGEFVTMSGPIRVTDLTVDYSWEIIYGGTGFLLESLTVLKHKISAFWFGDL